MKLMLSPYHPLQLVFGLTVWTLWFVVMYGFLSVACVVNPPPASLGAGTWINAVLLVLSLVSVGLLLYLAHRYRQASRHDVGQEDPPHQFIIWMAIHLHLLAAVATIAVGVTVLFLPPCL
jgi:hypothetical protein